jgi:hypothetical protein
MQKPNITLTPVDSSQIYSIGHDPATNTLAIRFNKKHPNGGTSKYKKRDAAYWRAYRAKRIAEGTWRR